MREAKAELKRLSRSTGTAPSRRANAWAGYNHLRRVFEMTTEREMSNTEQLRRKLNKTLLELYGREESFEQAWKRAHARTPEEAMPKLELIRMKSEALRFLAAIHESGHVVAYWAIERMFYRGHFGGPHLRYVHVYSEASENGSRLNGLVTSGGTFDGQQYVNPKKIKRFLRERACVDIAVTMAGPISEAIYCNRLDSRRWPLIRNSGKWMEYTSIYGGGDGHEHGDLKSVKTYIPLLGRRWRMHLQRAFVLSDKLVREHQPYIYALAKKLHRRGRLKGKEIKAIFERVERDGRVGADQCRVIPGCALSMRTPGRAFPLPRRRR
jgi:hypothetical protein